MYQDDPREALDGGPIAAHERLPTVKHRADDPSHASGRHRGTIDPPAPQRRRTALALVLGLALTGAVTFGATAVLGNERASAPGTPAAVGSTSATTSTTSPTPPVTASATATHHAVAAAVPVPAPACPADALTVVAAPGVAVALRHHVDAAEDPAGCPVTVSSADPADVLDGLRAGADRPAVWIPDSTLWLERAASTGVDVPTDAPSVASTAIVLALTTTAAGRLAPGDPADIGAVLRTRATATPLRVGLADPDRSAVTALALVDIRSAAADAAGLTWGMRSTPAGADLDPAALTDGLVVPTTAQVADRLPDLVTVAGGSTLDHPFAVLTTDPAERRVADALLTGLLSGAGRQAFVDEGFGAPAAAPFAAGPVTEALRVHELANAPSRMLAVLDISGSMAAEVPGTEGRSRLDLARAAAQRGLSLYGDDSEIGVWEFSRRLDGDTDHRELVPIGGIAEVVDGASGRERIDGALARMQVAPNGDTGLYDTTLAAVRTVRAGWSPDRVNTVLLLTDGHNDDPGSIDLDTLVATLAAEADPARPVAVIAIGFGSDVDSAALGALTGATGGKAYLATDPRQIAEIFLDAVGQRSCRPAC